MTIKYNVRSGGHYTQTVADARLTAEMVEDGELLLLWPPDADEPLVTPSGGSIEVSA